MLGENIYNLRKNRKISQEEFAEILNTSRQAVSKWERNEAKPDIDKLILIAKLFNVSIDYLLNYEVDSTNIKALINTLKESYKNNNFTISINDIKTWCSKYPNNFELYLSSSEYLYVAYINNNDDEYLELALLYINKAINQFIPEYSEIISLNDLHFGVVEIYLMQKKYGLAKEYAEENNVYGCDVLLAKCDLALKKYDEALNRSSDIYLKSVSDIMNISIIQIMVLLKKKKIQESYELINWSISFIKSVMKDNHLLNNLLCPFLYLKGTCERLLDISSDESIRLLKEISLSSLNNPVVSETKSLKYYFGTTDPVCLIDSNNENSFKEIIKQTSKDDIHYETLIDIYNEIFKGGLNE